MVVMEIIENQLNQSSRQKMWQNGAFWEITKTYIQLIINNMQRLHNPKSQNNYFQKMGHSVNNYDRPHPENP